MSSPDEIFVPEQRFVGDNTPSMVEIAESQWQTCIRDCLEHLNQGISEEISRNIRDALQESSTVTSDAFSKIEENHKKIVQSLCGRVYELENCVLSMLESSSTNVAKSIQDSLCGIESSYDHVGTINTFTSVDNAETVTGLPSPYTRAKHEQSTAISDLVQKTIINAVCFQKTENLVGSPGERGVKKMPPPNACHQSLASYFTMVLEEKDMIIERLNSQIESLSRENVNLESELEIQQRTTVSIEAHSNSKMRIIELEGTLEKSQLDLMGIRNDLTSLRDELNAKEAEFAELKKETKVLQEELDELKRCPLNSGYGVQTTTYQDDAIRLDQLFDCQPIHPLLLHETVKEVESAIVTAAQLEEAREVIAVTKRELYDLKTENAMIVKQLKKMTEENKAAIADMEVAVFQNSILSQQLADALVSQRCGPFSQLTTNRESPCLGAGDLLSDVRPTSKCPNREDTGIRFTQPSSSNIKKNVSNDDFSQFSSEGRTLLLLSGKKRNTAAPYGIIKPVTASVAFSEITRKVLSTSKDSATAVGVLTSKSTGGEFLRAGNTLLQNKANITLYSNEEPSLYLEGKRCVAGLKAPRREIDTSPNHPQYNLETLESCFQGNGYSSPLSSTSEETAIDISQLSVQDVHVLIQRNTSLVAMLATYVHAIDVIKTEVLTIHEAARKSASHDNYDDCNAYKGDVTYTPSGCFFTEYEQLLKTLAPSINRLIDQRSLMLPPKKAKKHRKEYETNKVAKTQSEKWFDDYNFMSKLNVPFVAEYATLKNALFNLLDDDLDKPFTEEKGITSASDLIGVPQPEEIVVDKMESDIVSSFTDNHNERSIEPEDDDKLSTDIFRTALGLKVQETCSALKAKVDRHSNLILDVSSAWSKIYSSQNIVDDDNDQEDEFCPGSVMQLMIESLKETVRCYAKTALEQHIVIIGLRESLTKEKKHNHQLEKVLNGMKCGEEFLNAIADYKTFFEQFVISDKLMTGHHARHSTGMFAETSEVIHRGSDVSTQFVQVWEHIELILQNSISRETTALELLKARQRQRDSTAPMITCPAVEESLRATIEELQVEADRFRVMYENLAHHHSMWMDKVWTSEQQVEEYKTLAEQAISMMVPNDVHANVLLQLEDALNLNRTTQAIVDTLRISISEKDEQHAKIFLKYNEINDQMNANDAAHREYEEHIQYELKQKDHEIVDKNETIFKLQGIHHENTIEIGNLRNAIVEEQNKVDVLGQALKELQSQTLTEPLVKIIFPTAADVIEATNVIMKELREQVQQYRTTIYEQEMELQRLQLAYLTSENGYKGESCRRQELSLELSCCKEQLRTIEERTHEATTATEVRLTEAIRNGHKTKQELDSSLLREEVLREQIEVLSSDHQTTNVRRYGVAKTKELQSQIEEINEWLQQTKEELRQRTNELEEERIKSHEAKEKFEENDKVQLVKMDSLVHKIASLEADLQSLQDNHNELNETFNSTKKRLDKEIEVCKCDNESLVTKQNEATQKIVTLLAEINSLSSQNTELCSTIRRFEISDRQAKTATAILQKELISSKKETSDLRASYAALGGASTASVGRCLRPQALRKV